MCVLLVFRGSFINGGICLYFIFIFLRMFAFVILFFRFGYVRCRGLILGEVVGF